MATGTPTTTRYIGTCSWAGHTFVRDRKPYSRLTPCPDCAPIESTYDGGRWIQHSWIKWAGLKSRVTKTKCSPACTSAKSAKCACECGGKNHGQGFVR